MVLARRWSRWQLLLATAAVASAGLGAALMAPSASATTTTVSATADAYVSAAQPSKTFGTGTTLKADASPVMRSYLRFSVALPVGTSVSAVSLRLSLSSSGSSPLQVRSVADPTWTEKSLTYSSAPAVGPVLVSAGGWSSTGYKTVVLPTSAVNSGKVSFALETTSSAGLAIRSRETTSPPRLIVTYAPTADTTAPDTTVRSGPSGTVEARTAAFTFGSTEAGSTFQCQLDAAVFQVCSSPTSYSDLAGGEHTFAVRATDPAGNTDPSPATRTWTVVGTQPAPPPACGAMAGVTPHVSKVVWIWFENKGFDNLTPQAAPYFHQVKDECGYAAAYTSVTDCNSLPEYIASTSGSPQGICANVLPSEHPLDVDNVFRQISTAGMTWISYQDAMPSNCARTNSGTYAVKHNPAAYYAGSADIGLCESHDLPLPAAPSFTSSFTIVEPDLCHSMHDCSVSVGDAWLRETLPQVVSSADYQAGNTAVFVTFDEGGGPGGETLFTLVLSPYTPAGTVNSTPFNHYSLLATLEGTLGLPCLGNACTATDMRDAFMLR